MDDIGTGRVRAALSYLPGGGNWSEIMAVVILARSERARKACVKAIYFGV